MLLYSLSTNALVSGGHFKVLFNYRVRKMQEMHGSAWDECLYKGSDIREKERQLTIKFESLTIVLIVWIIGCLLSSFVLTIEVSNVNLETIIIYVKLKYWKMQAIARRGKISVEMFLRERMNLDDPEH